MGWRDTAACLEGNISFFPMDDEQDMTPEQELDALVVCSTCPAVEPCLQYALKTSQTKGVWGMHTPQDRRNLKRQISRRPGHAQRYWEMSFDRITLRIASTLDAEAAQRPVLTAI